MSTFNLDCFIVLPVHVMLHLINYYIMLDDAAQSIIGLLRRFHFFKAFIFVSEIKQTYNHLKLKMHKGVLLEIPLRREGRRVIENEGEREQGRQRE